MIFQTIVVGIIKIVLLFSTLVPQTALSIGFVEHPTTFLPHEVSTDSERAVSEIIFRKLFKYEEGELVADLVDDWSISEDKTEYKVKLKDDIYWQDGKPITSNDIIYSITLNGELKNELDINRLSDKEVLIVLPKPNAILPSILTFGVEPSHLPNQSKLQPIGSTSYRVVRLIRERDKILGVYLESFAKNKQYNRIIMRFYDDENNLKDAYKLGEINSFLSTSDFTYPGVKQSGITYLGRYFSLIFNTANPRLEKPEIREKLAQSIDIDGLLSKRFYQNSLKADGAVSYSALTVLEPKEEKSDPTAQTSNTTNDDSLGIKVVAVEKKEETEKAIVPEVVKPNIVFTDAEKEALKDLQVVLPNNPDGRQMELFLRETLEKEKGLKLEVVYKDLDELPTTAKDSQFDIIFIGHEVTPDPDRYPFWHSTQTQNGLNIGNFSDLRADKALEEGRSTDNLEERRKHYNIFTDVVKTKVPAVFLYHPGQYLYTAENIDIPLPKLIYYPSDILKNL